RRRRLDSPRPLSKPWTPDEIQLLGTKPDRVLARKFKRRTGSVQQKRWCLGIPPCSDKHVWRPADDNLLGEYPDEDIARFLKVSVGAVAMRRAKLDIAIKHPKVRLWTTEEEALLGTLPDEEVAKKNRGEHCLRFGTNVAKPVGPIRRRRSNTGRRMKTRW